jgi:Carbohydrate esterase, sialic acid-specific acetylesterase
MMTLRNVSVWVLLLMAFLVLGCEKKSSSPSSLQPAYEKQETLEEKVKGLQRELSILKMQLGNMSGGSVKVSTGDKGYYIAQTKYGSFAIVCGNVSPYLDGYKAQLSVGNLTNARFNGAKIGLLWGKDYNNSKDMSVTNSFLPGMYTTVEVILTPAKPEDIKTFAVTLEFDQLALADFNEKKVHLFILSGQSNMSGLHPDESFTPSVKKAFSGDEIIVVKDAHGGYSIGAWYEKWKPPQGQEVKTTRPLYDRLMTKVKEAINGKTPSTITFIWMQGESDALRFLGKEYAANLRGLINQLREDLKFKDINFVIGRLSDFNGKGDGKGEFPSWTKAQWTMVRQVQVEVAESDPRGAWVDTDDLNGRKNDLHYTKEGYKILGKRFAAKAINLIKTNSVMDTKPNKRATDAPDDK